MAKQQSLSPPQVVVLGFLSVILIGTVLLSLPQTTVSGERQPLVDALLVWADNYSLVNPDRRSGLYDYGYFSAFAYWQGNNC